LRNLGLFLISAFQNSLRVTAIFTYSVRHIGSHLRW